MRPRRLMGASVRPLNFTVRRPEIITVVASVMIVSALTLDVVASVCLVRSPVPTFFQKSLQLMFIWILPFIGAIIVVAVLLEAGYKLKPRDQSESAGDVWLPGIGPDSGAHHGHDGGGGDVGHGGDPG